MKSNQELLSSVTDAAKIKADDLDQLYDALAVHRDELNVVFVNKSELPEEISVYFGMLGMTIEEVSETREGLKTATYYFQEEDSYAD